jgi:type 1 fimbriae regulatory protein FimB
VDAESRVLHVARLKKGLSTTHPLRGDELRVIKAWLADRATMKATGRAFFVSRRRKPLNRRTAWLTIRKYGDLAGLEPPTYGHQFRHVCCFALADRGAVTGLIQDNPGHRDIRHIVIYTATNPARFERLWW